MRSIRFPRLLAPGGPPLLLDGAMGTALQARGLGADLPEAWLLARPEAIAEVHRAHAAAGARLLLTCTFNAAAPRAAALLPAPTLRQACLTAARLAREAAGRPGRADGRPVQAGVPGALGEPDGPEDHRVLVAGAIGPLAMVRPGLPAPPALDLGRPFLPALRALAEGGVDLLWLESQYDRREASAALAVATGLGLPVVLTFTLLEREGRLVAADGTAAEPLLLEATANGAAAVGVNCVAAGPALAALARWASATLPVPFVAKPSPGLPGAVTAPEPFAEAVAVLAAAGARLVGGCCGATADHVAALTRRLGQAGLAEAGVAGPGRPGTEPPGT